MDEMLFMNEPFKPSIAVPIRVTVTMPITMPSVVSTERSLFARMALQEIARPSRSSVTKFMRSCFHDRFVAGDEAVADADDTPGLARYLFFVCDDDDGVA